MAAKKAPSQRWVNALERILDDYCNREGIGFTVTLGEAYDLFKKGLMPREAAAVIISRRVPS